MTLTLSLVDDHNPESGIRQWRREHLEKLKNPYALPGEKKWKKKAGARRRSFSLTDPATEELSLPGRISTCLFVESELIPLGLSAVSTLSLRCDTTILGLDRDLHPDPPWTSRHLWF